MSQTEHILNSLIAFLTEPDKTWSLVTVPFMFAFVAFFLVYILIGRERRTLMMGYVVLFSLFFAYKANGLLMLLLPATVLVSWWLTRQMHEREGRQRLWWMWATVVIDLLPLAYFKYTNFFIDIVNDVVRTNFAPLSLLLPIGISFYTFQAISYTVDVYKRKYTDEVSLLEYAFYLTFFPLIMAGPITRAGTLLPQLKQPAPVTDRSAYIGLWLIIVGMLKKLLIADYIAQYNNWIFEDPMAYSGFENLMGVLGYTLQIYCDFSGYSDLSIGIAALMGFQLKENFRYPYQSLNLGEFWHRWHISLSTWFRDYLYIPLGGNRRGTVRTYVNNFITMAVCGLWHGASWMFVFWGAMHGVGLMVHKASKRWLDRLPDHWTIRVASFVLTFTYVAVLWVFFRADSMHTAYKILDSILYDFSWDYFVPFVTRRTTWTIFLVLGYALHAMRERHVERIKEWFVSSPWTFKLIVLLVVLQLVVNFRQNSVQPFIYAQF